jgi:signal transduction histidine kinase
MRISYFILLGFLIILIMFSITTYINYVETEKVDENSEWFAKSTTIARQSNRFQRNILNMVSGLRGYLITGENEFIQAYDSAEIENQNILSELDTLLADSSSTQREILQEVRVMNDRWLSEFSRPLINAKKLAGTSDSSQLAFNKLYREKLRTSNERNINRSLQIKLRDFSNYEYDLREIMKNALSRSIQQTRTISFYLNIFSVIIGLAIAVFLAYRISTRIVSMVKMADSIAAGNYSTHIEDTGKDELSQLAGALNHMSGTLNENIALLKRKNDELDQFAHIVSHDLKAPLRGIDNVVTWIEEDHSQELSPKMAEYIGLIKGRIVRAENLIRGILSYSRVGREAPEREEVNVEQLIREIEESIKLKPGIKLIVEKGLPVLFTERIPLQQVFTNLISNANNHHDKNDGWIKVGMYKRTTHHEFFVEDNGPGISKAYHDKIFLIFQTLQERDARESTGVGLAIVKKILTERKQEIEVASEPGKGSIFSFTWPL